MLPTSFQRQRGRCRCRCSTDCLEFPAAHSKRALFSLRSIVPFPPMPVRLLSVFSPHCPISSSVCAIVPPSLCPIFPSFHSSIVHPPVILSPMGLWSHRWVIPYRHPPSSYRTVPPGETCAGGCSALPWLIGLEVCRAGVHDFFPLPKQTLAARDWLGGIESSHRPSCPHPSSRGPWPPIVTSSSHHRVLRTPPRLRHRPPCRSGFAPWCLTRLGHC